MKKLFPFLLLAFVFSLAGTSFSGCSGKSKSGASGEPSARDGSQSRERTGSHVQGPARKQCPARQFQGKSSASEFLGDLVRALPHGDPMDDRISAKICE